DSSGVAAQLMAGGSCLGTVIATSCTETAVPAGSWKYTVTPATGNWRGGESAKVDAVVGSPTLVLTPTTTATPVMLTGSVANFVVGQPLQFRLDNASTGALLTGTVAGSATPAAMPAGANAAATVTLPAGISSAVHRVYAVSSGGELAAQSVTVDNTPPPAPALTSNPTNPSIQASATFSFTDSGAVASYLCKLDGGAYVTCTSPTTYPGLTDGSHTFSVTATNSVGTVSAAAAYTWTVDTVLPTGAITFPTNGSSYNVTSYNAGCSTAGLGDLCGTAADAASGVSAVRVSVQSGSGNYWNGASFGSAGEVLLTPTGTSAWTYGLASAAMSNGVTYTVRLHVTDAAGNTSATVTSTFTNDTVAPASPTITAKPALLSTTAAPSFSFTDADATATFTCTIDGAAGGCTSPRSYAGLSDGFHAFSVTATDPAGNTSASTQYFWALDATGPTGAITFPASGSSYNAAGYSGGGCAAGSNQICGTASDAGSGVSSVTVSVQSGSVNYYDGSGFTSGAEVRLTTSGTTAWNYGLPGLVLTDGTLYTVRLHVTDFAGNTSTVVSMFTYDTTAPTAADVQSGNKPGGVAGTPETGDTLTFSFSEPMRPASILSGWTGASTPVVVKLQDGNACQGQCNGNSLAYIYNSADTAVLPLGTIDLGGTGYVSGTLNFTGSSMVMSGSTVTVTLGTPSGSTLAGGMAAPMMWSPVAGPVDRAGNAMVLTTRTQAGPSRLQF
ncbi:MAG: Ig-like domain repeat protein, partial [Actinomycetota bacterium]|nr:Ig-like domain repeat protein [Actinomycetota bacterium]